MPKSLFRALGVAFLGGAAWILASCQNSSTVTRFQMISSNLGFSPQSGSSQIIAGVAVNGPIVFRFNLPVNPSTVNPNTIQIFEPDNNNAPAQGQLFVGPAPGLVSGAGEIAFVPSVTYDSAAQVPQLTFGLQFNTKYRIVIPNDQPTVLRSFDGQSLPGNLAFEFTTGTGGSNPSCPETGDAIVDPSPGKNPEVLGVEVFKLDQPALGQGVFPVEVSSCGTSVPSTPDPIWIRVTLDEPANTDQCIPNLLTPPTSTLVNCAAGGSAGTPAAVLVQSDPVLGDSVVTNVQIRLVTGAGSTMFPLGENPVLPRSYLLIIPTAPLPFLNAGGTYRVEIDRTLQDLTPVPGGEATTTCPSGNAPCCFFTNCNCVFTLQSVASCI